MSRLVALTLLLALGLVAQEVVFHSEARLVEVYATVFNDKGRFMDGLARDQFAVAEDGRPQQVLAFESDSASVSCVILLDTTGSMRDELPRLKNAVIRFIDQLREIDSVAIYSFTTSLVLLQDFTSDHALAKRAVLRTSANGATALFDAIAEASHRLGTRSGKKAVVVFTDGDDNSSVLRARGAVDRAKKSGVPVYMVAEGEALHSAALMKSVKELSESTGGAAYEARRPGDVAKVFDDVLGNLQHTYLLAYRPPQGDRVKWRSIQLKIVGLKDYKVRAKEGYFPE